MARKQRTIPTVTERGREAGRAPSGEGEGKRKEERKERERR